jgi:hypothetical protein
VLTSVATEAAPGRTVYALAKRRRDRRSKRSITAGRWASMLLMTLGGGTLLIAGDAPADRYVRRPLHYAPNHNFSDGTYVPAQAGFNLADVSDVGQLKALPAGVPGLIWIGQCAGVDARFIATITPYIDNAGIFGFFLMDDPDPRPNRLTGRSECEPGNLMAESDWIHTHVPGAKTFIVPMNLSSAYAPSFLGTYNPENTHVDFYGIDPYPCRTEANGCDYTMIDKFVRAAEASGIPRSRMVPSYQTFGGGKWRDGNGGIYILPTAEQLREIMDRWRRAVPAPAFDMAYSWGSQNGDVALENTPELQRALAVQNAR